MTVAAGFLLGSLFAAQAMGGQSTKRGIPFGSGVDDPSLTSRSAAMLSNVNAVWYYNYSYTSALHDSGQSTVEFVPMVFSLTHLNDTDEPIPSYSDLPAHILGYNEPNHTPGTSGCSTNVFSPADGASNWPAVNQRVALENSVGPASAEDGQADCEPWTAGSWYKEFHDDLTSYGIPHPKDIALHIYTCNIDTFKDYLNTAHANYPDNNFWVTEFACETEGQANTNPSDPSAHPSQDQVYDFIQDALIFMENTSWVTRYSWHDSRLGTSKIFQDNSSDLTCTGVKYSDPYATPSGYCAP